MEGYGSSHNFGYDCYHTQQYSSGPVQKTGANTTATMENTTAAKKGIAPGFEFALALMAMGTITILRKIP
ncbi:MAG: hypothetical protein WC620_10430 [Methanoregula sp.]|jgi:hypothetical protein